MKAPEVDKSGKVITTGQYIVNAYVKSMRAVLKFGKVVEIVDRESWSVRVVRLAEERDNEPTLSKPSFLQYPERCLVIPFDVLPQYAQTLLGPVKAKNIDGQLSNPT